jgi:kallikrein
MKQVEMDIVDFDTCNDKLKSTRLGPYFELDKSFNCAGGLPGRDTCTGDGGGPLVCPNANGQYEQVKPKDYQIITFFGFF